jgi:hypothetical protein
MKRPVSDRDPELEALLEPCRVERRVPPELRARVLARARAVVAGDMVPPVGFSEPSPPRRARGRRVFQIALAASLAVTAAAAGAMAALHARSSHLWKAASPDSAAPAPLVPVASVGSPVTEPPLAIAAAHATAKPPLPARPGAKIDLFTAELDLLQRAHGAYTRRDFAVALTLIAEHARRFPQGHLAEQREALRVRSLIGAGRLNEAHRAAAAFAVRFPRSVLLPRVAAGVESSEP